MSCCIGALFCSMNWQIIPFHQKLSSSSSSSLRLNSKERNKQINKTHTVRWRIITPCSSKQSKQFVPWFLLDVICSSFKISPLRWTRNTASSTIFSPLAFSVTCRLLTVSNNSAYSVLKFTHTQKEHPALSFVCVREKVCKESGTHSSVL